MPGPIGIETFVGPSQIAGNNIQQATGGDISTVEIDGIIYRLHIFDSSDDFIASTGIIGARVLLVASGGGTGNASTAVGGASGGQVDQFDMPTILPGTYSIVVPAGGAVGTDGSDAEAFGFPAVGGLAATQSGARNGRNGSGGSSDILAGGIGTNYNGGDGRTSGPITLRVGGGGSGEGGDGVTGLLRKAGDGGAGVKSSITGTEAGYGGGGGGSAGLGNELGEAISGHAVDGGGSGSGADVGPAANGSPNSGGGAGGNHVDFDGGAGRIGGSGRIIVRYPIGVAA